MEPVEIFRKNVSRVISSRSLLQVKIAEGIDEPARKLNDYLKGRINWGEQKRIKLAKYLGLDYHRLYDPQYHQHYSLKKIEKLNEPFPRYMDIMALSIRKRPWAIKSVAAESNGIHGWNESTGDEQLYENQEPPKEHQRYFNGEITEVDLYDLYDRYFKKMVEKLERGLEKEGL